MRSTPAAALLALAAAVAAGAQEPLPLFSTTSSLVVLPVVVSDREDGFVTQLTADDFVVYDNGRPQPIAQFTNRDAPVSVALVVDSSSSMAPKLPLVIASAAAFARSSNPDDELFAIEFNDTVKDAIPGRVLSVADVPGLTRALSAMVAEGRTGLYNALLYAMDHVALGTRERKVLIVISDGGDNISAATLGQVLARARASDVTIYTIGLFDDTDGDRNPGVLKSLARTTGGERFLPDSPGRLLQACQHIAREVRSVYTIGYTPPERDGRYHQVRVDVRGSAGRRLRVRTRLGYVAPQPPRP